MELILKLIVMISIFCFMGLAFRTNLREYKIHKEELIREGNLPSSRTRIRGVLKTYGIMIGIALIITIVVIYVRKLEFSISMIFSTTLLCLLFEIIIGSIVSLILEFIKDGKERGLIKGIIALFIAYPFELQSNDKDLLVNAASQSKWSQSYIIDNFLCAAIGANIGVDECKRKIFVYSLNNLTYMGLVFAGGACNVNILEKRYDELTEIDINNTTEKLLNEVSIQLPEEFANLNISPKDLDEVSIGWKLEIERKIYLCTSPELKNKFGLNIGTYQLVYIEYENSILEGLKKIIAKVETGNNYTATRIN